MYMTQAEWDRRHHREEQRQRRNEIISRVALFSSFVAISVAFYFMTMVRCDDLKSSRRRLANQQILIQRKDARASLA